MTSANANVRAAVEIPLAHLGTATVVTFDGLCDGREHLAILAGYPRAQPAPLVRLHSECLTGDVFGSARCDCGPQLDESLRVLARHGGILLYLRQEGRGIGLYNKLDAYRLQDQGYDTYAANQALDFADDLRDYQAAAQMLRALGADKIVLLSNNPDKAAQLTAFGIELADIKPTGLFLTPANYLYLEAKARLAGHSLVLPERTAR